MKNLFKAFAKKLFGTRYERAGRTLLAELIVFLSLYIADLKIQIAPSVLYLMSMVFSAGIMWQALSASDNQSDLKHALMLPLNGHEFVAAYVGSLGAYTLLTKTAMLWAVVLAVSSLSAAEVLTSILCALSGILLAGNLFSPDKQRLFVCLLSAGGLITAIFLLPDAAALSVLSGVCALAFAAVLSRRDPYSFLRNASSRPMARNHRGNHFHFSMWKYFFRYLTAHKNYLANTAGMCGIACFLPLILGQAGSVFALPIGCAILTMNTPLCILLSCDPALEQAVRFLPGQKKLFCIPYCLFIFSVNLLAEAVFLCSFAFYMGSFGICSILTALFFASAGAAGSVWLEWFHPIRNWKIESDLWHHPRKYIVPAVLIFIGSILSNISSAVLCR